MFGSIPGKRFTSLSDYLRIPPLEQFPPALPNQQHLWVAFINALPDLSLDEIALKLCSADEIVHQLDATTNAQQAI